MFHESTKHIEVNWNLGCIYFINSKDQLADILTKSFCGKLGAYNVYAQLEEKY